MLYLAISLLYPLHIRFVSLDVPLITYILLWSYLTSLHHLKDTRHIHTCRNCWCEQLALCQCSLSYRPSVCVRVCVVLQVCVCVTILISLPIVSNVAMRCGEEHAGYICSAATWLCLCSHRMLPDRPPTWAQSQWAGHVTTGGVMGETSFQQYDNSAPLWSCFWVVIRIWVVSFCGFLWYVAYMCCLVLHV